MASADQDRLRGEIDNLNVRKITRSNILKGLNTGKITNDSARRIIDEINAEQAGVVQPIVGPAPPVAASDPNLRNREAMRDIFNRAGVSDNGDIPANAQVGFTPPVMPIDPNSASLNETEARNEMMVTASRSDATDPSLGPAAEIAALLQPELNIDPNLDPAFLANPDELVTSLAPSDVAQTAAAFGQPRLDMPRPDFSAGFDLEGFPDIPEGGRQLAFLGSRDFQAEGLDRTLHGLELNPGGGIGELGKDLLRGMAGVVTGDNPVDRFIGKHLLPNTLSELQEADREIRAEGEGMVDADAHGRVRRVRNVINEVGEGAFQVGSGVIHDLARPFAPLISAVGGLFDFGGGGGGDQAVAEENVKEEPATLNENAPPGVSRTDSVGKDEDDSAAGTDTGKTPPVSGVDARSDTPGAEGGEGGVDLINDGGGSKVISSFGYGSVHQGGAADRILGLALPPREERGPGVEVIRGMRQTFQPTDAEGRAEGSEIPFGRGTLQRLENLGATFDEAVEYAVKIDEANSEAVRAGAFAHSARANAMVEITADFNDDGNETQGLLEITPDGRIIKHDLGFAEPLSDRIQILRQSVTVEGQFGPEQAINDVIVELIHTPQGAIYKRITEDVSAADEALIRDNTDEYEGFMDAGFSHDEALQMLKESQ